MTQRSFVFVFLVALGSCRYLAPATPAVSPERPALLSSGNPSDPTRQAAVPGRACVMECGAGQHCDERSAQCVADAVTQSDAGVRWLP